MTKIFLISDTHFGHLRVIQYEGRPFKDTKEMDNTIIANWNRVVSKNDTIYHLGDISLHGGKRLWSYLSQLNGHITIIRGNHDQARGLKIAWLDYGRYKFRLSHELPLDVPEFSGEGFPILTGKEWSIVGHSHMSRPFIDKSLHVINVCVERINYTPIEIKTVVEAIKATDN